MKEKILIIGASGYIGRHLFSYLGTDRAIATYNNHPVDDGIYFDATRMRISDILKQNDSVQHGVILLGMTNPNSCIERLGESTAINVTAIKDIIDELLELKIKPVFISTESVFDGNLGDYTESDVTNPILTYGKQKMEVEDYLEYVAEDYTILRLSNVVGDKTRDKTLFTSWIEDFKTKNSIRCARDQRFSPVYINDVIDAIQHSINNSLNGTFHVSGPEGLSRLQLLEILISKFRRRKQLDIDVQPCSIHDFPVIEKRPLDVTMLADKLIKHTGLSFLHPREICDRVIFNAGIYH